MKLVRKLASRRWRDRLGLFVCEGEDLVEAGLDAGLAPVEALVDAERPVLAGRLDAEPVEPKLLAAVSDLGHAPRVIAIFRRADLPQFEGGVNPPGLSLWRVGDPGNVGTLLRAADALGGSFVCLSPGCADPTSGKALRASAGAVFRVPIGSFDAAPRPWVALVPEGGRPLSEIDGAERATFVLGAEREGLPADVVSSCDVTATIPIEPHTESLNVALAGAIALYEATRRDGRE